MADEKKEEAKKVKRPTSQKRDLQNERQRIRNKAFRSRVRTALKGFLQSTQEKDKTKQITSFAEVASLVDKGVNKGVFTRNKASRVKARLSARIGA